MAMPAARETIGNRLKKIYGPGISESQVSDILGLIGLYAQRTTETPAGWSQDDIVLITYGDSIGEPGVAPLETLNKFLVEKLRNELTVVHILPFFPYSSDDGFSVIDYLEVDPALGSWDHIERIAGSFDLMFDFVVNHISRESQWFRNYLEDKSPGKGFFIEADPGADLSMVTRPRSLPLLTPFKTSRGKKFLWTTFSEDQIDLDFSNPRLLEEMLRILLEYVRKGARIIRLDAIAFLWKRPGTGCIHLPETHEMVKLFRDAAALANPGTIILTETNVPNEENLSYFGSGDEAHMIYQFSLPPLLLEAIFTGDSTYLTQWAKSIPRPPEGCTFFNFTASHDGIGVRPLEGLLPEERKSRLYETMKRNGGYVSTRRNPDGSDSPYEINITYYDALRKNIEGDEEHHPERFLASQTIMLALRGIPAFYIHSLLSSPNYVDGVKQTGRARAINRQKLDYGTVVTQLEEDPVRKLIFGELRKRMRIRKNEPLFHPDAPQEILDLGGAFFALRRRDDAGGRELVSITNMKPYPLETDRRKLFAREGRIFNILNDRELYGLPVVLGPYETKWLLMG